MYLLMGPIGSGKSVQGELLEKNCDFQWISMGNLFRQSSDKNVQAILHSGKLVKDETTQSVLADFLEQDETDRNVVLDGFPRTLPQAEWLAERAPQLDKPIEGIINLVIDEAEAKKRLLLRKRHDDTEEAIKVRIAEQTRDIAKIVDFWKAQNIPIYDIDADGTIEEVHKRIATTVGCTPK